MIPTLCKLQQNKIKKISWYINYSDKTFFSVVMQINIKTRPHLICVTRKVVKQLLDLEVPHFQGRVGAAATQQSTVGGPRHLVDSLDMTPQRRQVPGGGDTRTRQQPETAGAGVLVKQVNLCSVVSPTLTWLVTSPRRQSGDLAVFVNVIRVTN